MSEATTDRELLELAARAAGHPNARVIKVAGQWMAQTADGVLLNCLHDDGDAFRLATTLRLSVSHYNDASQPHPWLRIEDRNGVWTHAGPSPEFNADPLAATRRAITRAAAEIGREMK